MRRTIGPPLAVSRAGTQLNVDWSSNIGSSVPAINAELWESFPAEVKQIFAEAGVRFIEAYIEAALESYAKFADGMVEFDVVEHKPDALNAVLQPFHEQLLEEVLQTAPEGVADPVAALELYESSIAHWSEVLGDITVPSGGLSEAISAGPSIPWKVAIEDLAEKVEGQYYG